MTIGRANALSIARRWLGVELDEVSAVEKLVSAVGGGTAILVALLVCDRVIEGGSTLLVASMGASAVLLFAVPHGQLSQPWPVLVGHIASAAIGVACATALGPTFVAAAAAVGLAIGAMHLFKSIHPPGGATALTAVLGGPAIADLGFEFVVVPVALNAGLMVLLAVAFNGLFPWRRYPAAFADRARGPADPTPEAIGDPTHRAVLDALREVDSFIDITEEDLIRLHRSLTAAERKQAGADSAAEGEHLGSSQP
jgi:CBS-domain-containing membrane protein